MGHLKFVRLPNETFKYTALAIAGRRGFRFNRAGNVPPNQTTGIVTIKGNAAAEPWKRAAPEQILILL